MSLVATSLLAVLLLLVALPAPAHSAYPSEFGENGRIAFVRGGDVYTINADGSGETLLHDHESAAGNPIWAAVNGGKIAFCRSPGIYTMNSDGSDVTKVADTPDCAVNDGKPSWSADNSQLAIRDDCRPGSDTEICIVNSDGTGLVAVTDNSVEDYSPAWSPDGSKIAFVSQGDIFTINPDGSGLFQVTNDLLPETNRAPNWSPDGTRIAFESDRDCIGCNTNDIYSINPDGTGLVRLTATTALDRSPAYSPGGGEVVFESCDPLACTPTISVMNADGTGQTPVTQGTMPDWGIPASSLGEPPADGRIAYVSSQDFFTPNRGEIYTMYANGFRKKRVTYNARADMDPDWERGGDRIVFTSRADGGDNEIYRMSSNGGSLVNLTSNSADDAQPNWSHDGQRIAFASDRGAGTTSGIYVMNSDGSAPTEVTDPPDEVSDRSPAWGPLGDKIAFVSDRDGDDDIYFVNPDGSGLENVTNTAGIDEGSPAWAPDGQKLAYVRIESGSPQSIWTMNRNGTGQTALTSDPAGADSPSWSLTGAKIAFARAGDIYSINVDGTGLTDLTNTPYTEYQPAWQQRGRPPLFFYPRPRNASPTNIRLVPAYKACAAPNGMHGEPLHSPSCDPPVLASDYLTTGGTPAVGANGSGLIILKVFCTDATAPPCPASGDQEDVGLTASITDVRKKTDGSDYTGELRASLPLRVTDRYNAVALFYPATAVDVSIGFPITCVATGNSAQGSTCSAATTADALMPDLVRENLRTIWQLGQFSVYDGGADGDGDTTGDNTLFEVQGTFTP